MSWNRRDFLTRAAGSAGSVALLGAPLVLTSRKASAQSASPDPDVMRWAAGDALNVYQDLVTSGRPTLAHLQTYIATMRTTMSYLDAIGMTEALGNVIAAAVPYGCVPALSDIQGPAFAAAQGTPMEQLPLDFFLMGASVNEHSTLESFYTIKDGPSLMALSDTYLGALDGWIQAGGLNVAYHPARRPELGYLRRISDVDAAKNAVVASAVGGALITGGGALVAAASVAPGVLGVAAGSSFTVASLLTGGVILVVIGIAVVGWYGYKWIINPSGGGGGVQNPGPPPGSSPCGALDAGCTSPGPHQNPEGLITGGTIKI